ncbi:MAG: nucleotide-binding protein [Gammaproteobacteria bacterium]|nr:nucleotide-binding protein [Gammaproteobacteria bacterium]
MPSFDVVSELEMHEIVNAVDQANREVSTRFDFKGTHAKFELNEKDKTISLEAPSDFQLGQMQDILNNKLIKRNISSKHLKVNDPIQSGKLIKQVIDLQEGIDKELAKEIIQLIKEAKFKVKASIQDTKVRVVGDKKDELQSAIALLRKQNLSLPLQFNNFRD